jgi:predicted permease
MMYTTIYALVMNILGWTVGSFIVSGDKKYISVKKIFVNPAAIGFVIGLPFLFFEIPLPDTFLNMLMILGRMTSPLSMLIMGMRLATTSFKNVFGRPASYAVVAVKGMLMPLIAYLTVLWLPMAPEVKQAFYIIAACPTASIVLNFSELCGYGQKEAASMMLLSTILSIITLPIMMLLL